MTSRLQKRDRNSQKSVMNSAVKNYAVSSEHEVFIPPGGFEPPSPDPKSCMIDRYTTGVNKADMSRRVPSVPALIFYASRDYIGLVSKQPREPEEWG